MNSAVMSTSPRLSRIVLLLALSASLPLPELSAAKSDKVKPRKSDDLTGLDTAYPKAAPTEDGAKNKPGQSDAESRQLAKLRERLEVKDDAEWAVVAERLTKVEELRRTVGFGAAGSRAAAPSPDKIKRSPRGTASAQPEYEALRTAVDDQFPDAEIRARLARARDAHQQRESQLKHAQSELRAVLSVRQEAVVVMVGLLPP